MTTHHAAQLPSQAPPARGLSLQRTCACGGSGAGKDEECTECRKQRLQRRVAPGSAGGAHSGVPPIVHDVLHSPGVPLEATVRTEMEGRFGHDFGRVRVHTDRVAAESARAVHASAYTVGGDIVFAKGQYAPAKSEGRRLLAHELMHVVQQRNAAPGGPFELGESGSVEEREAEAFEARTDRPGMPAADSPLVVARKDEPPAPTTEDCSEDQTRMLNSHLDDARTWVNDAAPKVASYAYFFANPRVTAVPANPAAHDVTRNALRDNFHTTRDGVLSIRDGFDELRTALNGSITFECEDEGCTDRAYVRGAIAAVRRLGDIHVCPPWFNCRDYYRRVTTLIHERAHQYPGATDNAYEWQGEYATLDVEDAIDNAESFAVAARQIYHGGAHGPGTTAC